MAPAREDSAALAEPNLRAGSDPSRDLPRAEGTDRRRQPFLERRSDARPPLLLRPPGRLDGRLAVRPAPGADLANRRRRPSRPGGPGRLASHAGRNGQTIPRPASRSKATSRRSFDAYLGRERAPEDGFLATFIDGEAFDAEGAGALPGGSPKGSPASRSLNPGRSRPSVGRFQYVAVDITGGGETGRAGRRRAP